MKHAVGAHGREFNKSLRHMFYNNNDKEKIMNIYIFFLLNYDFIATLSGTAAHFGKELGLTKALPLV